MEPETAEKTQPSQGWLPSSLRKTYLIALGSLLTLMLVVVEILRQYSHRNGYLLHWKYEEDLPGVTWQAFTYLPLVIALLAIVLLDICAQDVFRLEVFFQLAKPNPTPAKVLFTNYCSNGLTASVIALRNRHWIVFCVASVSLIFRMFLPTLVSGIIVLSEDILVESKVVNTWPDIVDLDTQTAWFASGLANHGVLGHSNLGSVFLSRPSKYAAAPVSIPVRDENEGSLLTLNQTTYWSNMTCLSTSQTGNLNSTFLPINSTSGSGNNQQAWLWKLHDFELLGAEKHNRTRCQINLELEITMGSSQGRFHTRYWEPYNKTETNSTFTPGDGCSSLELFGAILDLSLFEGNVTESNFTILGCTPLYHQAEAAVTLDNNASISALQTDSSSIKSLDTAQFYVQGLHDYISSKFMLPPQSEVISNSSSKRIAMASNQSHITSTEFTQEIQSSWNRYFITAMNKLFDPAALPTPVDATLSSYVVVLTVVANPAIITEAILGLCLVLLGMLALICHRRPNLLQWDPGSIAAQCALISRFLTPHTKLLFSHANFRQATTRQLRQWSKGKWVEWVDMSGERRLCIVDRGQPPSDQLSLPVLKKGRRDPPPHFLVFPWFLSECILLMGVLAAFGVCLSYLRLKNIESYASTGATLSIIFIDYAPTAIASIIGSLVTSIYRNLSAMEPWIRLQEGMATAKESILANRGFRTPYMALTQTRRQKPALLFGISLVCIADLVLRVLSGGVFEPQVQVYKTAASSVIREYSPSVFESQVNETGVGESIMAASRLMNNVSFLPWVSPEVFFVPFTIKPFFDDEAADAEDAEDVTDSDDAQDNEETDYDDDWLTYSATTHGIGADLECRSIYPESNSTKVWSYKLLGDTSTSNCSVEITPEALNRNINPTPGNFSIQFITPNGSAACQSSNLFIFASWDPDGVAQSQFEGSMALQCQPKVLIQQYDVKFNSHGMIQSYKAITASSITKGAFYQNASTSLGQFNSRLTSFPRSLPHHTSSSMRHHDWFGLLTTSTYESLFPHPTEIISNHLTFVVNSVYRRVFSAHLALWRDKYLEHVSSQAAVPVRATATESLWGITPSMVLIVIIICLVCIDTCALMVVFLLRFNRFKGLRVPRSLGSLIPLAVGGSFAADCGDVYDMTEKERRVYLLSNDRRYRLGQFAGDTGDQWGLDYDDCHRTPEIELDELRPAV